MLRTRGGARVFALIVCALCAMCAVSTIATPARAQDEDTEGVRRPERLTVGVADQFLGQLAPDRKTLYFASNRKTTNEIYGQSIDDGRARILFDEGAEVTWPRVSPDGKSLLYISYGNRATGQLCVRELPSGEDRRCLEEPSAALLAEWTSANEIILVARASIDGNLRLLRVTASSSLSSRTLLERNATSPTVSPDRRWLVYVPLERSSVRVGPAFAAHAAAHLEAVPFDDPGAPPTRLAIDLPGVTGQPVFAKDGRFLYFVQFFSDSNRDGVVDGSDNGVLFRAPLSFGVDGRSAPVAARAKQLTEESWNCQYPAPTPERLLSTCSRKRSLDIYSLPLDGEVPSEWSQEKLAGEIELASSHAKLQLLYYDRLTRATTLSAQRFVMVRLVRIHLALDAFSAAEFYSRRLEALDDPTSKALAKPLLALVEHRKSLRERERGRIVESFEDTARAQLAAMVVAPGDSSAGAAMARVVRSEIADRLGDKALARSELEATPITSKQPRSVVEAYYERADTLYRELDDRDALVAACRRLAKDANLSQDDRLRYARAAVRSMARGRPFAEADALLAKERESAEPDSELQFAIDLGRAILGIREPRPGPEVRTALIEMYEKQTRVERRRAIMIDAVERATQFGADSVIERLAEHYVESVGVGSQERRRAERLYTRAIVGRAFRRRAADKLDEARSDFEAVAKRTGALEAVVGAIDLRMRAGEKPAAIRADYDAREGARAATLARFVTAYTLSRELPKLEGEAHANAAAQAIAALKAAWADLKKQCMGQALYGAIQHEGYLRTGDLGLAERASSHYLVALELTSSNLRYRAMVLGQLGILHTQVGNYRIALGYLDDRDRLPYAENAEGFAVRLAKARALLHVGRDKDAAAVAEEALAMLDKAPRLAGYRVLALDRAALYNMAANRFARALALYDAELPILEADRNVGTERNRFVVRLARAAAALGAEQPARAMTDLDEVERAIADPQVSAALLWPHSTNQQVVRSYRLITSGLRAQASQRLGQHDAAMRALEARRALLEEGLKAADRGEYVRQLTLVEAQLADNAAERHDSAAAAAMALRRALDRADNLHDRARGAVDTDQLDVLWLAAEMSTGGSAVAKGELVKRLAAATDALNAQPSPALRTYQRWFEIYLTLLGPLAPGDGVPPASAPAGPAAADAKK